MLYWQVLCVCVCSIILSLLESEAAVSVLLLPV